MGAISGAYRKTANLVTRIASNYRRPATTVEDFIRRLPRDTELQVVAFPYHPTVAKGQSLVRAKTLDGWKLRLVLDFSETLPKQGKQERALWMSRVNATLASIVEEVLAARPKADPRVHGDPSHGGSCGRDLYLKWLDSKSPFEYR